MPQPVDPGDTRRRHVARILDCVEALVRELEPEKTCERPAAEIGVIAVKLAGGEATWCIDYEPAPPAAEQRLR